MDKASRCEPDVYRAAERGPARPARVKARLKRAPFGLALNDYVAGDGPALFAQACAMGLEGIVSKRRSSPYRSGRSPHWLKAKNPESPAVRREALSEAIIAVRDWMWTF